MSTNLYTAQELACCVARFVASGACDYARAMQLVSRASVHNVRAVAENYHEQTQFDAIVTADELERLALPLLAAPQTWLESLRYGSNLLYNCAECPALHEPAADLDGLSMYDTLKPMEEHAHKWFERLEDEAKRKEENDKAYSEEPPLPYKTGDEIRALADSLSCARVIVAEFGVNESDSMTDHFGGRSVRRVVIGFGKGKRENFRELRAAAAAFPPASDLACDRVACCVTVKQSPDDRYGRDVYWRDDAYNTIHFRSIEEANAAIEELRKNHPECQPGYVGCIDFPGFISEHSTPVYPVQFPVTSPEHRENYSMGGGNYLGWSRYGGWSVYSLPAANFRGDGKEEFFEAPKKIVAGKVVKPAPLPGPQEPKETPAPFPRWTEKGYLQKTSGSYDWPHTYRKEETARKDLDRLAAMGITAELVHRRRGGYAVRLVSAPAPVETQPEPAPRFDVLSVL